MATDTPDVKAIFGKALEIESAADRSAYLDEACGGKPDLRAEDRGPIKGPIIKRATSLGGRAQEEPQTVELAPPWRKVPAR